MTQVDNIYLDHPYQIAGRHIDPINGTIKFKDDSNRIRRKELEVLALLISADHGVVSRDEFIEQLWSHNAIVGEKGLTRVISDLRNTLIDDDKLNPLIRTIPRQGYQLNSTVSVVHLNSEQQLSVSYQLPAKPDWKLTELISSTKLAETWKVKTGVEQFKELRFCSKQEGQSLLAQEFKLLSYLKANTESESILTIEEAYIDALPGFLVLPYTSLGSLSSWVKNSSGLSLINKMERLDLLSQWSEALVAIHNSGMVHRNLGPDTVYIDDVKGIKQAKIGGFAMAVVDQIAKDKLGLDELIEVPFQRSEYIAPEMIDGGSADQAVDVYAFGVLIFKVMTGDLQVDFDENWKNQISDPDLQGVIKACTSLNPSKRLKSQQLPERLTLLLNKHSDQLPPSSDLTSSKLDRQIGPFKLLEKIGEGGMGTVYLAEQFHPVERLVALKLLKKEMETDMALARFRAESQALAMINHVNVASIYETGSLESGLPYFVMEYVEGQFITEFCDAAKLNIRERAELFLQVCDGLLHAHQKSIIHRDLNPSNIIVKNESNQNHLVKIIDFGVAKSMQKKLSNLTLHTQSGEFVGTPQYASPEQIGCFNFTIDTRADIYSIGVIFYEVLLGLSPQQNQINENISSTQLIAQICNNESPLLIEKLKSLDDEVKYKLADLRSCSVNRLTKELQHEPTWIIAKCLEQNPEKRYGSVMELKQDILRWLRKEPVQAQNNLKAYKFKKFIGRNRIAVMLGSIACLLLMATSLIAVTGYLSAEKSAKEAQRATEFIVNHIQTINPEQYGDKLKIELINSIRTSMDESSEDDSVLFAAISQQINKTNFTDLSLAQLNDSFFRPIIKSVDEEFKDNPEIKANLYQSIATALFELGLDDQALLPQVTAVELKRKNYGDDDLETLSSTASLAMTYLQLGQFEQALEHGHRVYEKFNQVVGERHPLALKAARNYGKILVKSGQVEKSLDVFKKTRPIHESVLGMTHIDTAELLNAQAVPLQSLGKFDEAMNLHKKASEIYLDSLGDRHPKTLTTLDNLANYYGLQKNIPKATELFDHVLTTRKEIYGQDHHHTHKSQLSYATFLMETNQQDNMLASIELFEDTLEFFQTNYGVKYPRTLETRAALGTTYLRLGEYQKAKPYVNEALSLKIEALGEKNSQTALSYIDSAWLNFMLGDMETYQDHYDTGIAIYTEIYGEDHAFIEGVVAFFDYLKESMGSE